MKSWFSCTVKYHKEDDKGNRRKITEPYLVDAVSFSEAEARIYHELGSIIKGEFTVSDINRSNFEEVFHFDDSDTWFKGKVCYTMVDEESEKEKKITKYMLVSAPNLREAYQRIEEALKDLLVPFTIPMITESAYVEVFVYDSERLGKASLNGETSFSANGVDA